MFLANVHRVPRATRITGLIAGIESRWFGKQFGKQFWIFFSAALLYDFGIGLYFFLFNLFLANLHFRENVLGLVTGALTLGNVAGSIPVSIVSKRFGLQKTLLLGFAASPLICIARTFFLWMPAQIGLAFLAGSALSAWTVCFAPAVARLTTEENRVSGFSIVFASGIGTGTLAGLVGGYLPEFLNATQKSHQLSGNIRVVLLLACAITLLGILPILRLRIRPVQQTDNKSVRLIHPFLLRFLPPFFLWSVVTGSFTPFAAVYLQQHLHIQLANVGVIFSMAQLAQLAGALAAPFIYQRLGTIVGIVCVQLSTGIAAFALGHTEGVPAAILFYLCFASLQFMSGPGIYSLLMTRIPVEERGAASAVQNMTGSLSHAGIAVVTGLTIVRFGYSTVLAGNAAVAVIAALALLFFLGSLNQKPTTATEVAETI
jgi:MFS family permease